MEYLCGLCQIKAVILDCNVNSRLKRHIKLGDLIGGQDQDS